MGRRRTAAAGCTVLTAVPVLLGGCSNNVFGDGGQPGPPVLTAAPAGVGISVLQYRSDYTARRIQIKVTNGGDLPVVVTAVRLDSPALHGSVTWRAEGRADEVTITPGTRTDLPAQLPPVRCASERTGATAVLELRGTGGSTARTPPLTVEDPFSAIADVHTQDCLRARTLAVTSVTVGPLRIPAHEDSAELDLRLVPTGRPGSVTVESVGPTTLLAPPAGETWPVGRIVDAASGPRTVTLRIRPARCDPHAVAEDKLGTVLPLTVQVGSGPAGVLSVPADPSLRTEIQDFVRRFCAGA